MGPGNNGCSQSEIAIFLCAVSVGLKLNILPNSGKMAKQEHI
jgi:hypothetical protein